MDPNTSTFLKSLFSLVLKRRFQGEKKQQLSSISGLQVCRQHFGSLLTLQRCHVNLQTIMENSLFLREKPEIQRNVGVLQLFWHTCIQIPEASSPLATQVWSCSHKVWRETFVLITNLNKVFYSLCRLIYIFPPPISPFGQKCDLVLLLIWNLQSFKCIMWHLMKHITHIITCVVNIKR